MQNSIRRVAAVSVAALAMLASAACNDSSAPGTGTMKVQLTDAPFSSDSVSRVDLFVVRVDAKMASSDSADAARAVTDDSTSASGWTTLVSPMQKIELLALRNGIFTALGAKTVTAGSYQSFRLIIDPSQSSVTLKNGAVLTGTSTPSVSFPSAARTGIKINLVTPIVVTAGDTTTTLVDFNVNNSFVQRGSTIAQNGLLFKPVVTATVR